MSSLYINNLILSLEDLRNELEHIHDSVSTAAIILLTKFRDGSLSEWLREGNDEEVLIADKLDMLDSNYPDSKILERIICTICDTESSWVRTDYSKVLKLDRVEYSDDNGRTFQIVNTEKVLLRQESLSFIIKARFIILNPVNEVFLITSIIDYYGIDNKIRLSNYSKEEIIEVEYEHSEDMARIGNTFNYRLDIDNCTPIFTAHFERTPISTVSNTPNENKRKRYAEHNNRNQDDDPYDFGSTLIDYRYGPDF